MTLYESSLSHSYLDYDIVDYHHLHIIENLLRYFRINKGETILEIGSGTGRYTKQLLLSGLKVIATEPDHLLHKKLCRRLCDFKDVEIYRYGVKELLQFPMKVN
jgi:16S rRNA A1518/A1519 N6-dimethyltransferase RsmA/KsgA/DIM1 with predicted DNA glycosylase/AP lyase activity